MDRIDLEPGDRLYEPERGLPELATGECDPPDRTDRADLCKRRRVSHGEETAAQRWVSGDVQLPDGHDHLRCDGLVLREVPRRAQPHRRPDGAGGAVGPAEYRGREPGGGYSEQLAAARLAERNRKKAGDPCDPTDPVPPCPKCGKIMVLRTAKSGKNAGKQFWGCSGYPECKGVVSV